MGVGAQDRTGGDLGKGFAVSTPFLLSREIPRGGRTAGQLFAGSPPGPGACPLEPFPPSEGHPTVLFLGGDISPAPKPRFSPALTEPPLAPAALPGPASHTPEPGASGPTPQVTGGRAKARARASGPGSDWFVTAAGVPAPLPTTTFVKHRDPEQVSPTQHSCLGTPPGDPPHTHTRPGDPQAAAPGGASGGRIR